MMAGFAGRGLPHEPHHFAGSPVVGVELGFPTSNDPTWNEQDPDGDR